MSIGEAINNVIDSSLFMESLRNLNWSRGYLWYVELDGVPSPFQRGGVIGLPVINVQIQVAQGNTLDWNAGLDTFVVPFNRSGVRRINLQMYDDEQGTIAGFFERWYNLIYNPYKGVLPVNEAVKQITIRKLKSTRSTAYRYITDKDGMVSKEEGRNYLVFPNSMFQEDEKNDPNPRTYSVELVIAKDLTPDFGPPPKKLGQSSIFGIDIGEISTESGFLSKLADYI